MRILFLLISTNLFDSLSLVLALKALALAFKIQNDKIHVD